MSYISSIAELCHFRGVTLSSFIGTINFPIRELGETLDTEQIIEALKAERLRIDKAIAALGGGGSSSSRPARATRGRRGPRHMSAEARKRISDAQKRRWAEQRRKAKS